MRKIKDKLDTKHLFLNLKSRNITRNKKLAGKDTKEITMAIEETKNQDILVKTETTIIK
jgi:hypothetical protein